MIDEVPLPDGPRDPEDYRYVTRPALERPSFVLAPGHDLWHGAYALAQTNRR